MSMCKFHMVTILFRSIDKTIYEQYKAAVGSETGVQGKAEAEAVFKLMQRRPASPRVACLCGYLKTIVKRGERFVIVAERISLIRLAVFVIPPSQRTITDHSDMRKRLKI